MSFTFTGKAGVLRDLAGRLTASRIPRLTTVTRGSWSSDPEAQARRITHEIPGLLAVRSSAPGEDGDQASQAGRYVSVLGVDGGDIGAMGEAVASVLESYDTSSEDDEVLIQEFVTEVAVAGVLFTRDLNTGAPYVTINYDDVSGLTDAVASGRGGGLKTVVACRHNPRVSEVLSPLLPAIREIESVTGRDALDIEFALTPAGEVLILQVRPMTFAESFEDGVSDGQFEHILQKLDMKMSKLQLRHPELHGDTTGFGVMPDWNPAEIIGFRPRRLAISLYKELVTDSVWAEQRAAYGYKDLRSFPLLISFVGIPFIDIRVDLNSFVPRDLAPEIAEKLVGHYLERFRDRPELHDKVEFDIVVSCAFPGFRDRLRDLGSSGITLEEQDALADRLTTITRRVMASGGLFEADLRRLDTLRHRYDAVVGSDMPPINRIYWLVQDCKRYGTLPFAGIARSAFIAMQILDGLVSTGALAADDRERFLRSLNTTGKRFQADLRRQRAGILSREDLLKRYGHLRQGTYNVTHDRYDTDFERFFRLEGDKATEEDSAFEPDDASRERLRQALQADGLDDDPDALLDFIRRAIEGRESSKLEFTRHVSRLLEEIVGLCGRYGLGREEISYLDIRTLLDLYATLDHRDLEHTLKDDIARNRAFYEYTKRFQLPHLTFDPRDIYGFELPDSEPNFITLGKVAAPVAVGVAPDDDLKGRVVCIESADPGFDWIFSRGIAGLVTQFGGANSHMAIRCAELGLPAVIGAGAAHYRQWSSAGSLEIDCSLRLVRTLS